MSTVLNARNLLVFLILSYAIAVSVFIDSGQRNYLVLFAASLSGLLFLVFNLSVHRQAFWALILFCAMAMRITFLGGLGQLGSVALTFVYALGYFAIGGLLERVNDRRSFIQGMMGKIIYAFAILSVLQLAASFSGLPIPNLIGSKGFWSYNSLSYEPSQLGRIVGISMLCYLMLERLPDPSGHQPDGCKARVKVWVSFLATMLLSGSALAAIAIIAVFALSRSLVWAAFILFVCLLLWPTISLIDFEPVQRAILLISNLGSLDLDQVLKADHSGGLRFAPLLVYLEDFSTSDSGFWLGYGSDGLSQFLLHRIPGLGDQIATGFAPGFAIVYGVLIAALFLWIFALSQVNRTTAPLIAFWLIFFINSAWNTQVFWYGLIVIQIASTASREPRARRQERLMSS